MSEIYVVGTINVTRPETRTLEDEVMDAVRTLNGNPEKMFPDIHTEYYNGIEEIIIDFEQNYNYADLSGMMDKEPEDIAEAFSLFLQKFSEKMGTAGACVSGHLTYDGTCCGEIDIFENDVVYADNTDQTGWIDCRLFKEYIKTIRTYFAEYTECASGRMEEAKRICLMVTGCSEKYLDDIYNREYEVYYYDRYSKEYSKYNKK